MLRVYLNYPNGDRHDLTGTPATSGVLSPVDSLVNVTGTTVRTDRPRTGRAGSKPGRYRYDAIITEVEFYLHGDDMETVYKQFRAAWSLYGEGPAVVLEIHSDKAGGPFYYDMWLNQPLPGVPVDSRKRSAMPTVVSVFIPSGLARAATVGDESFPNSVMHDDGQRGVVDNTWGDVPVYPVFRAADGSTFIEGTITGPSGATAELAHYDALEVSLDPMVGRAGVLAEAVAPGETGTYTYDNTLSMGYTVQVGDPWSDNSLPEAPSNLIMVVSPDGNYWVDANGVRVN